MRIAVAVMVVMSMLAVAGNAVAQECTGTKQHYAGKCRYPKDIAAMKKQAAAQKAAEQRRREEAARNKAEAEAREKEAARQQDQAACDLARTANSVAGWRKYLKSQPGGICLDEGIQRITELSGKPPEPVPPSPEPQPDPDPEPDPTTQPTPTPAPTPQPPKQDSGGISPLVWIGFGVAALGLVIGGITGGVSIAQVSDLETECSDVGDSTRCPPDKQDDVDTMLALAHTSTAFFIVAGVGATLGIIGFFVGGDSEQGAVDVRVGPGSLSVGGRF